MRACALTYRELQSEFVSNPTAPTSQRERKFWDRQMGVKRRNHRQLRLLTPICLSLRSRGRSRVATTHRQKQLPIYWTQC